MKLRGRIAFGIALATTVATALAVGTALRAVQSRPKGRAEESDRTLISQRLPELDGKNLTATIVEVNYPPGTGSEPHSHPCAVIGYVVSGTIESQVKGQPAGTYTAGQTFYEPANGVHAVSRNPSSIEPAQLLAYFLCDHAGPLSIPVPATGGGQKSE